jgi:hypothetical protein
MNNVPIKTKRLAPGEYIITRRDGFAFAVSKDDYERGLWWVVMLDGSGNAVGSREDVYSLKQAKELIQSQHASDLEAYLNEIW